jgi:GNAT superfamily N-acetyltransferase
MLHGGAAAITSPYCAGMPPDDVVREPPTSDLALGLLQRYYAELDSRFPSGFEPEPGDRRPEADLVPPDGAFLVARLDGRPVGCGGVRKLDGATAEIKRMWIDPTARGRGVGGRLLSALEDAARDLGCPVVRLDTSAHLTEAISLYRSRGYADIPAYNDNPYADRWFETRLY